MIEIKQLLKEILRILKGKSSCQDICTNNKDTYHEWNMAHGGKCFCDLK